MTKIPYRMLEADCACDGDLLVTWFESLGCDRRQ